MRCWIARAAAVALFVDAILRTCRLEPEREKDQQCLRDCEQDHQRSQSRTRLLATMLANRRAGGASGLIVRHSKFALDHKRQLD